MGLFKTHWTKQLTIGIDPSEPRAKELEKIRRRFNFSHEEFAYIVETSAAHLRLIISAMAEGFREEFPKATDKQILAALLILCNHLHLDSKKGIVSFQDIVRARAEKMHVIERAMQDADDLLDRTAIESIDGLASAIFYDTGNYRTVPTQLVALYHEIDWVFGYVYLGDVNNTTTRIRSLTDINNHFNNLKESIGKLTYADFEWIREQVEHGTSLERLTKNIAARRNITPDAVMMQLYLYMTSKGNS